MIENQPLVTIVTASYKKFDRIFDTIKSVIRQDYNNIEYIIADDGSPNFPQKEIEDYLRENASDLDYKIYHSEVNKGTVKNLNHAFKNSKGDYVFPLSCGDEFFSNDVVCRIVDRFSTTNAKLIVTTRLFHNNYKPICLLPHYYDRNTIEKLNTNQKQYEAFVTGRHYNFFSGSAMYYSRCILDEMDYFDEQYLLLEDAPFVAKYLQRYPFLYAFEIISIWYEYGGCSTGVQKNSFLLKDQKRHIINNILSHSNIVTPKKEKIINFRIKYAECNSKLEKIKLFASHPITYLCKYIYSIRHRFNTVRDNFYIKKIIKQ